MANLTCKVDNQGRVMLPSGWRKRFNVGPATQLIVREDVNGSLVVETKEHGLQRAQQLVARYIPSDAPSLVEDLLEERWREAASE